MKVRDRALAKAIILRGKTNNVREENIPEIRKEVL